MKTLSKVFLYGILAFMAGIPSAYAAEHVIIQKDKTFFYNDVASNEDTMVDAAVGDTIRIVNNDTVTHNAYSLSDALFFDSGAQKPNSKDIVIELVAPGEVEIACALHPEMIINFNVTE